MAYDDESSLFGFDEFINAATVLERFQNVTVTRLMALTRVVHQIAPRQAAGPPQSVGLPELATRLREAGLGGVPFDTVVRLLDVVSKIDPQEDVLAHVTLRDIQRIVAR